LHKKVAVNLPCNTPRPASHLTCLSRAEIDQHNIKSLQSFINELIAASVSHRCGFYRAACNADAV